MKNLSEIDDAMQANILAHDMSVFDKEEIYTNCTVQIWSNSVTGAVSVGWWENNDG